MSAPKYPYRKLTNAEEREIINLYHIGIRACRITAAYHISVQTIQRMVHQGSGIHPPQRARTEGYRFNRAHLLNGINRIISALKLEE